jgi:hypothetical protein
LWAARVGVLVLPPLAFLTTYRLCLGVRLRDRETLQHGIPTGIIKRLPHGEFVEVHKPEPRAGIAAPAAQVAVTAQRPRPHPAAGR